MCEIPQRDGEAPYLRFSVHLWPMHMLPGRKPETIQLRSKMAAPMYCVCVCVCRVLSVMCNKVSFYRPASTSGQLLVTPEPQSQPQPQKHNSCPSDSCRFSSISPFPPLFQLQLQQRQLKMWPEFCRRRKLKALLWPVAIVRFFGQNWNSCAEVLQLLLPCSCQRRRTKH